MTCRTQGIRGKCIREGEDCGQANDSNTFEVPKSQLKFERTIESSSKIQKLQGEELEDEQEKGQVSIHLNAGTRTTKIGSCRITGST
jgi:hypothetical protein